jgi:transposase
MFSFIPLWGFKVEFSYAPRRIECNLCGVKVEWMPWADGNSHLTNAFKIFLARWAKRLSWKEVGEIFNVSWDTVRQSIQYVVSYGLKNRVLEGIQSLGIDEIQYRLGHIYLTLVYQIDDHCKRLLWIGQDRKARTLLLFFRMLGKERTLEVRAVCSDMWKPYIKVIRKKASHALHILDRFHIMKHFNEAIDKTRRQEARKLKEEGYQEILKNSRWTLLKKKKNLKEKQLAKLNDMLQYNLKTVKSYLLKESFQKFWKYKSRFWAEKFLNRWTFIAMRSKIESIKDVAKMLRRHQPLILNWFLMKKRLSNGIVEGFNNKVKLTMRKSYGFKSFKVAELALYHVLGELPEPELTHKFT